MWFNLEDMCEFLAAHRGLTTKQSLSMKRQRSGRLLSLLPPATTYGSVKSDLILLIAAYLSRIVHRLLAHDLHADMRISFSFPN